MLNEIVSYLAQFGQPLSGLFVGILLFVFVGFINWYGTIKGQIVNRIAKSFFRNEYKSNSSAADLFMVVSSFLVVFAGLLVIFALYFLVNFSVKEIE